MPIKHLAWGITGRHMRKLAGGVVIEPPEFVSATTNESGTIITVAFSKEMADPTGKHAQFTVNDGAANAVTAVALNADATKIDLTLTNAIENGDTVTMAYTKGDVESADGGVLDTFSAQSVTNGVPSLYQQFNDYPDSVYDTETYPYQCIVYSFAQSPNRYTYYLVASSSEIYRLNNTTSYSLKPITGNLSIAELVNGQWTNQSVTTSLNYWYSTSYLGWPRNTGNIIQTNNIIWNESSKTTVFMYPNIT